MSMEKYGVSDPKALQRAELAKVQAELQRRDRARGDEADFEKNAENVRAIDQLRARETQLLEALRDQ